MTFNIRKFAIFIFNQFIQGHIKVVLRSNSIPIKSIEMTFNIHKYVISKFNKLIQGRIKVILRSVRQLRLFKFNSIRIKSIDMTFNFRKFAIFIFNQLIQGRIKVVLRSVRQLRQSGLLKFNSIPIKSIEMTFNIRKFAISEFISNVVIAINSFKVVSRSFTAVGPPSIQSNIRKFPIFLHILNVIIIIINSFPLNEIITRSYQGHAKDIYSNWTSFNSIHYSQICNICIYCR